MLKGKERGKRRGKAAFSRESLAGSMTKRALANVSRKRRTSNCLCCELGSMKCATRSAAAAPIEAPPRFLIAHGLDANSQCGQTLFRMSFTRVSARFAVRSPDLLEGATLDWRAGGPNAAQPELITVSRPYIRGQAPAGKGALHLGHTRRSERPHCSSSINRNAP